MKAFTIIAEVKGNKVELTTFASSTECAKQEAMSALSFEMRGELFPLHHSQIKNVKRVK